MDYGNYNEEFGYDPIPKQDPPKWAKIIKRILKYAFITLLVVVWIVIFASIIFHKNDDLYETPILTAEAREIYESAPENFSAYRVFPTVFMSEEGGIQLAKVVYAESANELEIGVRIAYAQFRYCKDCNKYYTQLQLEEQIDDDLERADDPNYTPCACQTIHDVVRASSGDSDFRIVLEDSLGNEYEGTINGKSFRGIDIAAFPIRYGFMRISFKDVYLNLNDNIINQTEEISDETEEVQNPSGMRYYVKVYGTDDDLLFSACVYDNNTYISEYKYELPDDDYIK